MTVHDPHAGQPVLHHGREVSAARLVVILVHGRGGSAADMLHLADQLQLTDVAWLAPQAKDHSWYPRSFLAPLDQNEPHLTSALAALADLIATLGQQGIGPDRVALVGFSQGACLSLEFAARTPRRYAAVAALSGGLIGPEGTPRTYPGSLDATPVFLGCSDVDPHIPVERVRESAAVMRTMGAQVNERIYPGMAHTVSREELNVVRTLLGAERRV